MNFESLSKECPWRMRDSCGAMVWQKNLACKSDKCAVFHFVRLLHNKKFADGFVEAIGDWVEEREAPKFKVVDRSIPKKFIETESDGSFPLDDTIELLSEIEGYDGLGNAMVVYNKKMANWLEGLDAIKRNTRGSYREGPNRKEVLDQLLTFDDD